MSHLNETVRRIKSWINGKAQEPTKVDIFFTERCNLKCRFCNYSKNTNNLLEEVPDKKILKLIDEICEMDVKVFGVLGGEPFLRKKVLLKSMEKIRRCGIDGSIVTNATLLTGKDVERMVKMRWNLIRFSIDGLKSTHEYLRGVKGCFNKTLNVIKMFYKTKKKKLSEFPTLEVNFVLTNKNYKELWRLIEVLASYEINFIYVLPLIELTPESKRLKIKSNAAEINNFLWKAVDASKKYGIKTNVEKIIEKNLFLYSNKMEKIILENKRKSFPCFLPWYTINVNSNGFVTPCAQWPKSEGIEWNEKSLREIWFTGFEKMREEIKHNFPEWCSRCCVPLVDENMEIGRMVND